MKKKINKQTILDMDTLLSKMNSEDKKYTRITRNFQWIMWIMMPLYLIIFNFGTEITLYDRLAGGSFALAFLTFAVIFRRMHKTYSTVDYGLPTIEMLSNAAKRYKMQLNKIILSLIPIFFIDLAVFFITKSNTEESYLKENFILFQLIFFLMLLLSMSTGYLIWRKKQKPLRDAALSMLNEMQS